ncbi:MAG: ECF transporter S component [Tissierellia bacterium]|nr:ECF transporter S component [Tissierellia bacterium]
MNKKFDVRTLVMVAMLGAITVVLGMTPLGFVPIGPLNATTMHIPVIIGAILEGPLVGALVGLIFGLSSLFNAITRPTVISFVFYNPLISIAPRVLIGLIAYFIYRGLRDVEGKKLKILGSLAWILILVFLGVGLVKSAQAQDLGLAFGVNVLLFLISCGLFYGTLKLKNGSEAIMISAFLTTLAHSIMVLGGIYLFYAQGYMEAVGLPVETARATILGVVGTSGVPEGIIAAVISSAVVLAARKSQPGK